MSKSAKEYVWEGTLVAIIAGVIIVLTVVSHLTARTDLKDGLASRPIAMPAPAASRPTLGHAPAGSNRPQPADTSWKGSMASDELTLRLRVVSRATDPLVTPFQSAMLELRSEGADPINPAHSFSSPVPAGSSREEDIVFIIPSNLNLDHAALRVHYYNEQKEIPLGKHVTVHHISHSRSAEPGASAIAPRF
jgi:hypothetical protein